MDAAGVCDTPLQYWGLSSDKLTIILVHPPIPSIPGSNADGPKK